MAEPVILNDRDFRNALTAANMLLHQTTRLSRLQLEKIVPELWQLAVQGRDSRERRENGRVKARSASE
jgi:hypothetical protein